eukprot:1586364-Rhodomonas_salina.1
MKLVKAYVAVLAREVVTTHTARSIDSPGLWPDCPLHIAAVVSDSNIVVDSPGPPGCRALSRIIVVEFARCY